VTYGAYWLIFLLFYTLFVKETTVCGFLAHFTTCFSKAKKVVEVVVCCI